jgi:polyisoprenoid-binding protein YceI
MTRRLFLALSLCLAFAGVANAQTTTWTIDPAHSSVNFEIRHLGVTYVHGAIGGVAGTVTLNDKDITASTVNATIDATTVSTGVDARDKHLKSPDFFNVAQFPTLTFKATKIVKVNGQLKLIGDLTLTGVTKSVTLDVDGPAPAQKGMGGKTVSGFSASGVILRSDFNFGTKFAPPMLGDEVKFTIDLEIDK